MTTTGASALLAATPLGAASIDELRHKPPAEVAREFEAMLLAQMIGAMRKTVGDSGLLEASPERRMLDGFFDLELARTLLDDVDLGLARELGEQVEREQATAGAARASSPNAVQAQGTAGPHAAYAAAAGALLAPLAGGELSSPFGQRRDPIDGGDDYHAGLDLAAPAGTPVRAAAAGEVVFSGERGVAGRVVEIAHRDGTRTSYAHLASARVAAGDRVGAAEVIGAVGSSGRTTGPHLHFAVERGGQAVDPAPLLGRAPRVEEEAAAGEKSAPRA